MNDEVSGALLSVFEAQLKDAEALGDEDVINGLKKKIANCTNDLKDLERLERGDDKVNINVDCLRKYRTLINQILSDLEQAVPDVNIPDWYWEIEKPERYGKTKPSVSDITKGLLSNDCDTINKVSAGLPLLVALSNLIRVIGDNSVLIVKSVQKGQSSSGTP